MADNKIFITTSKGNNTIGVSGDNSQHFSNEARKSAEKSAQSAEEAKKYAEQTLSTKNDLLQNSDFIAVRNTLDEIVTVTDNLSIIETNAENIDAIKTTSNNINNINTTVTNIAKIDTVASNVNTMNTVVTNITPIKNTANNITAINNVNTNIEAVKTNASNISDIKTNATNITDIKNTAKLVTTLDEKVDKSDMVPFEMVEAGPYIASCAMPSDKYIDLVFGGNGTTYTAPANGWVALYCSCNGGGAEIGLRNVTKSYGTNHYTFKENYHEFEILPVARGDVFSVNYGGVLTIHYFKFIYAQGEN
jgi:hypothetical protein